MTDQRSNPPRRAEDQQHFDKLDAHIDELNAQQTQIARDMSELADTVLGTRATTLQGGGRHPDGLVHDMHDMKKLMKQIARNGEQARLKLSIPQQIGSGLVFAFIIWREVSNLI
jgi:hypothetical protein